MAVSPFISDEFRPPWPDQKGGERCGIPGGRQMWYGVIRITSAHLRATPEEGGVGIWEVVFQKTPVTKRGHQL